MLHQPRSLVRRSDVRHNEDIVKEREALQELVGTVGWRMFIAKATRDYQGESYHAQMGRAFESGTDNLEARVVHRTAIEVLRLLAWPTNRLRELSGDKA